MSFKPGDKIVFDWTARRNKTDNHKSYMILRYDMPQDFIYTVKEVENNLVTLEELDENFFIDRFKKYNSWRVNFRKETRNV